MKPHHAMPPTPDWKRPRDPATGDPLPATAQPGYYPGYSTLGQQAFWDAATRAKVLARVHEAPPIRFFRPEELRIMEVMVDHLLPQDDRLPERRIPIVPQIDQRLHEGRTPGYQFEDMPPDGEAYRLGCEALERMARESFSQHFVDLAWRDQEALLKSIHDGKPLAGAERIWQRMPHHRYWALVLQDCIEAYYAHPWAWDEVGFGGPAYPRAYFRLENGEPEPWEVDEQPYRWDAPADALSDPDGPEIATHRKHPPHGQGGTH